MRLLAYPVAEDSAESDAVNKAPTRQSLAGFGGRLDGLAIGVFGS